MASSCACRTRRCSFYLAEVWVNPTPVAVSEVFTSLQNATIGGQKNPLVLFKSGGFYEVQSVLNRTEHVRSWIDLTISERSWHRLSEDDQAAVMETAARTQTYERELLLADEEALVPVWKAAA